METHTIEFQVGDRVQFQDYDGLFNDWFDCTGVLKHCIWGRLWSVQPDENDRLNGNALLVHESCITRRMDDFNKEDGELASVCKSIEETLIIYGSENIEAWDFTLDGMVPILTDEFLGKD